MEIFRGLLPDFIELLKQFKDAEYVQLDDKQWFLDLAFLIYLTALLNELNLELQGKEKNIVNMFSSVNANYSCSQSSCNAMICATFST